MANIKEIIFGIAVLILTLFVTTYGVDTFYEKPKYENFCPNTIWETEYMNESMCFSMGGKWVDYDKPIENETGYCQKDYSCSQAYQMYEEKYNMNIFLIVVPLGILIMFIGYYFFKLESVSIGIMAGGVGTILRGITSYWRYSEDWLRFLISLIALAIVIWFGYKFGTKKPEKKSKK